MLNKQIPTTLGILIIVLLVGGVVGATFFLYDVEEDAVVEKTEVNDGVVGNSQEKSIMDEEESIIDEAEEILMDFLEHMYITGNYEKAAKLYTHHDMTEESKLENLERTASSVGVGRLEYDVERIEIVSREKISENEIRFEFKLIRENGEAIPFGPCCGDFETPTWYTYPYFVNKNNGDYNVYGDLLYIP